MTNSQRYKQAFAALHAPEDLILEAEKMKQQAKRTRMKIITALCALCVMLTGSAAAYAADVGGIQRTAQVFFCGDQTTATFHLNGNEHVTYAACDHGRHHGGASVDLTEVEPAAETDYPAPDVRYDQDGSVFVCWAGQEMNITDCFRNGRCYVQLVGDDQPLYMTVTYGHGYVTSYHKYEHH